MGCNIPLLFRPLSPGWLLAVSHSQQVQVPAWRCPSQKGNPEKFGLQSNGALAGGLSRPQRRDGWLTAELDLLRHCTSNITGAPSALPLKASQASEQVIQCVAPLEVSHQSAVISPSLSLSSSLSRPLSISRFRSSLWSVSLLRSD